MADITIRDAVPSDRSGIAYTQADSAKGDEVYTWLKEANGSHQQFQAFVTLRVRQRWVQPTYKYTVAVTPSGEVAGFIGCSIRGQHPLAKQWTTHSWLYGWLESTLLNLHRSYLTFVGLSPISFARYQIFAHAMHDPMEKLPTPHIEVENLNVHPDHQGKGIGTKLLKHVQAIAEENNIPIILSATNAGYPVYVKVGFKQVTEIIARAENGDEVYQRIMGWNLQ